MAGALAWQVKNIIKLLFFVVLGGDGTRAFFLIVLGSPPVVCVVFSFSIPFFYFVLCEYYTSIGYGRNDPRTPRQNPIIAMNLASTLLDKLMLQLYKVQNCTLYGKKSFVNFGTVDSSKNAVVKGSLVKQRSEDVNVTLRAADICRFELLMQLDSDG